MPAYHSGYLSKTDRPDYNYPLRPQTANLTKPLAPRNLMVTSPYEIGKTDLRWDNPNLIPQNSGLNILGVNVYRSVDSPYGPYVLLNGSPVGSLYYRDQTIEQAVVQEDVTATLKMDQPGGRWFVYALHKPIVRPGSNGDVTDRIEDVVLEIDDGDGTFRQEPAFRLSGRFGEVELITKPTWNYAAEQTIPARLPRPPLGRVRLSYSYLRHSVLSRLNQRIFYKVTAVAVDPDDNAKRIETPLEEVSWRSTFDMEAIDYIWREAILRNRWLLEQGGERVKVFIRKWMGEQCPNYERFHGQGHHDCTICWGTNYVGGYEGPYDIVIAPPETERSIELFDMGLHMRYDWNTWTSDVPILNERDVVVRSNNERFIVGPVNYQGSRGAIYQQHFTISHIDQKDIRYKIPIEGGATEVPPSWDRYRSEAPTPASPEIPVKPQIPADRIIKGRTVTFENISW